MIIDRKSNLRKPKEIWLGAQYTGSTISRDDLRADESDDDPFSSGNSQNEESEVDIKSGELDENDDKEEVHDLSSEVDVDVTVISNGVNGVGHHSNEEGAEDWDNIDMEDQSSMADRNSDNSSISARPQKSEEDDRAELRNMMAEEQKSVISTISKAAKADVAKGKAIQQQRSTFDSLLNTRIRLQKALVATNSLSAEVPSTEISKSNDEVIKAAEQAAISLWNSLDRLRQSLQTNASEKRPSSMKRPFSATLATTTPILWTRMQDHESTFVPHRRAILSKWSSRVHVSSTLRIRNALSAAPTQQPLTSILDQQVSAPNNARLIARTRVPRSCAPLQAARKVIEDKTIYDDADFYTLLLRELVDQRMSSTNQNSTTTTNTPLSTIALPLKTPKIRKQVDTKASKGRKMRYTVHEKLQNFMAPENRGTWGERQIGELFGSLLGAKVTLREDSEGKDDDNGEEGLILFRGR